READDFFPEGDGIIVERQRGFGVAEIAIVIAYRLQARRDAAGTERIVGDAVGEAAPNLQGLEKRELGAVGVIEPVLNHADAAERIGNVARQFGLGAVARGHLAPQAKTVLEIVERRGIVRGARIGVLVGVGLFLADIGQFGV